MTHYRFDDAARRIGRSVNRLVPLVERRACQFLQMVRTVAMIGIESPITYRRDDHRDEPNAFIGVIIGHYSGGQT